MCFFCMFRLADISELLSQLLNGPLENNTFRNVHLPGCHRFPNPIFGLLFSEKFLQQQQTLISVEFILQAPLAHSVYFFKAWWILIVIL